TTPNHPSYISGHSGVSEASAVALASFFGTDNISFSLGSSTAPGVIHSFTGFSAAAQGVGQSRIYGGIPWPWDIQNGLTLGEQVGAYVTSNFLLPASKSGHGGFDEADASSTRSPGAGPLSVGVLDPDWWTSTTRATDLSPLPAAWSQVIDLASV